MEFNLFVFQLALLMMAKLVMMFGNQTRYEVFEQYKVS